MLRITENEDEIIVREVPLGLWIVSFSVLAILNLFVYLTHFLSNERGFFEWYWTLIILLNVAGITFSLLTSLITTTKISKKNKSISIHKRNLTKNNFETHSFSEIANFIYVDEINNSRGISYRLVMPLKNGSKIELSELDGSKESQYFNTADLMNKYIFDSPTQIPFKLTVFNDN